MNDLRADAYSQYSVGYSDTKVVEAQFRVYVTDNYPQDIWLINESKMPQVIEHEQL